MNRIGESVHIDCRQLSKGITPGPVDGYSRPARVEVTEDKKALTVMFATLKAFNILKRQYGPEVEAVITTAGRSSAAALRPKTEGSIPLSACCRNGHPTPLHRALPPTN